MREIRYQVIAKALRARIASGEFGTGRVLPSEAQLSEAYGVSRITIRTALETLRTEGLVDARRGFGWFVPGDPVRQTLVRLGTIESQLESLGIRATRVVVGFRFIEPPPHVAEVLGSGNVLEVRRLTLADGKPFSRVTVWCDEAIGSTLSREDVARSSYAEFLDLTGSMTQVVGAGLCDESDAELLAIPVGAPVLRCVRIARDESGNNVLLGEHVFPAHLTELVVELPQNDRSIAPTGMRLLENGMSATHSAPKRRRKRSKAGGSATSASDAADTSDTADA